MSSKFLAKKYHYNFSVFFLILFPGNHIELFVILVATTLLSVNLTRYCCVIVKIQNNISAQLKFQELTRPRHKYVIKIKDKINTILRKVLRNEMFTSGSGPGTLYGLPKIHKPNFQLKPIFETHNLPSFNSAYLLECITMFYGIL